MSLYGLYTNEAMCYPMAGAPFRPHSVYPEYPFEARNLSTEDNLVYEGIRELFRLSGLDAERFGTSAWNPLGAWVQPGNRVLVKPNLVMHENPTGCGTDCLYTHPSVIAAVVDYVAVALGGDGKIVIADAPMQSCDFDKLALASGLAELVLWYRSCGLDVDLKDLRGLRSVDTGNGLSQELVESASGCVVDLGDDSSFADMGVSELSRLRITNYDPSELAHHHAQGRHEYLVSEEVLRADVIINIPKAKTHRKAGLTGALKNMVGVNVRKEYLPHHMAGSYAEGADEYERASVLRKASARVLDARNVAMARGSITQRPLAKISAALSRAGSLISGDTKSEGSWWGNDTIWRMVLDLNKIAFHADAAGVMRDEQQRKMLVVSDMVIIGQGEGPLLPEPGQWGMLALSDSPSVHDCAMARLMGSDESLIPTIREALNYAGRYSWGNSDAAGVRCRSNCSKFNSEPVRCLDAGRKNIARPTSGWAGHFGRCAQTMRS